MKESLDFNLEFLHTSYTNVQGILHFLDTKAGVIFALAGGLVAAVISSTGLIEVPEIHRWSDVRIIHFSILAGFVSLYNAVRAIWPSHGPKEREHFAWLYPALHPSCYKGENPFVIPTFNLLSGDDLLEQYRRQLDYLSKVLIRKTKGVRWALGGLISAVALLVLEHFV